MIRNYAAHIAQDLEAKPRVLLADSNMGMRSYTYKLLETRYDVLAVSDGESALMALQEWQPNLVVCDIALNKLTGMELLQELRDNPDTQTTPVILLSSHATETSRLQGIEAGADDYIVKPFNDNELMARISGLLYLNDMRKEAQKREIELKAETVNVLESIDEAFIAVDSEWRITYLNAHAESIHNISREDFLGKNLWESFPDTVNTNFYKEYQRAMLERVPVKFEEFYKPYQTWFEVNVSPVSKGGLTIYFRDISDRMRSEIIIKGQRRAFELAINDSPLDVILDVIARTVEKQSGNTVFASILLLDPDGEHLRKGAAPSLPENYIKAVNGLKIGPAAASCGTAAYTGKPVIVSDMTTDPLWADFRDMIFENNFSACWSNPIFSSSGKILGTFALHFEKDFNSVQQDWEMVEFLSRTAAIIIERQMESRERLQAEAALKEADRRKDEFLAILAHELRNPLAPISNALHVMRMPDAPSNVIEMSEGIIERQLKLMVRLVDDLMDVSRISRGKINLRKEKISLTEVINNALETSRSLIKNQSHMIVVNVPEEPIWLDGDFTRLSQVFSNLLNNAIKYTDLGGHITLSASMENHQVIVTVADDGIGIGADQLPVIFDIFSQVDCALDRSRGGLGIGLTLVKNLVELHGGTVMATSDGLGKGSMFTVRLPGSVPGNAPEDATGNAPQPATTPGLKILIVDDNEASAQTTGWMMEFMNCQSRIVHSAKEALRVAPIFIPDVVMLDIGLPEMDGYDVCRLMRQMPELEKTTFIAQTGWGQDKYRRMAEEAGFDHYLVKPVDMKVLEELLASIDPHKT